MSLRNVAGQGVRLAGKYIGLPILGAVGLGALPHLAKISQGVASFGQSADPESTTPTPPATQSSNQAPPSQAETTDQNAALLALLERLAGQSAELSQAELAQRAELFNKVLDPALYQQRAAIDQANYERQAELARLAGMEQTRELTRRKIEGDTISAWRGITEAQINRDTALGLGMMQMAYTSGMPNPNVLQAGASFAQRGAAGFTAPKSVI